MIEMWIKGYLAGIFSVMTLVLIHHFWHERVKRRKEREWLETYSRVLGITPTGPDETNDELRLRVRNAMRR